MIDLYALVAAPRGLLPHELPVEERRDLWRFAATVIWPGFEVAPSSIGPGDPIEVVDYDETWPETFASWREEIAQRVGDFAVRIEHIGSTSVPGLAAKPRVDIQVSVPDINQEARYVSQIESAGVQLRSRDNYHRNLRSLPDSPHRLEIHVCNVGSKWETDHLQFRDYLRSHPDACDAYAAVKRENAVIWADDGIGYTSAKSEIIVDILESARAWARER